MNLNVKGTEEFNVDFDIIGLKKKFANIMNAKS